MHIVKEYFISHGYSLSFNQKIYMQVIKTRFFNFYSRLKKYLDNEIFLLYGFFLCIHLEITINLVVITKKKKRNFSILTENIPYLKIKSKFIEINQKINKNIVGIYI